MGIDLGTLTTVHTGLSLLAILFGAFALAELLGVRLPAFVAPLFLLTAFATSATGFLFPFNGVLPSHITGVVALLALAVLLYARYVRHLSGAWRWIYTAGVVASEYLLVFVGVAQIFQKVPPFQGLAPTQSEPPFLVAQLVVLAIFVFIGIAAARRYHPSALSAVTPSRILH